IIARNGSSIWQSDATRKVVALGQWSSGEHFVRGLLSWCLVWNPPAGVAPFLVDGLETALAELTDQDYEAMTAEGSQQAIYGYGLAGVANQSYIHKLSAVTHWLGI